MSLTCTHRPAAAVTVFTPPSAAPAPPHSLTATVHDDVPRLTTPTFVRNAPVFFTCPSTPTCPAASASPTASAG